MDKVQVQSTTVKTIDYTDVESSSVRRIAYDPQSKTLHIEYRNGGVYAYHNVLEKHYTALMNAKSIGSHIAKHVKPNHKHSKISV